MGALIGVEAFAAAALPSPGTGRLEAGSGALTDESAFEFRQCSEDVEDEPPAARVGVDGLLEALEAYAAGVEILGPRDEGGWPGRNS